MKKSVSVNKYIVETNERGEKLVSFYRLTKKEFVAGCTDRFFYVQDDNTLIVELKMGEDYNLNIIFKDLEPKEAKKFKDQQAIMILEVNTKEDELPYHYVAVNRDNAEAIEKLEKFRRDEKLK
jgi:hypothetical protein